MPAIFFHQLGTPAAQQLNSTLAAYLSSLDAHASTKWFYAATSGPLDIIPGPESDALVARVFERLKDTIGVEGHNSSGATYEKLSVRAMMVWSAVSDRLTTKFSLVDWEGDLYAFVSGDSDRIDQGVEPWVDALRYALAKVNVHPVHTWQALIGMGRDVYGASPGSRVVSFSNAGMSVVPADFEFEEAMPIEASLNAHRFTRWRPFVVTGSTVGHSWHAAEATAHEELHLLCALLSAQTRQRWRLRQHPHPATLGGLPLPNGSATLKRVPCIDIEPTTESTSTVEPELQQLWGACKEDPECADIVRAYYESTQMSEHPSFALIGFVGVIEAVGAKLFPSPAPENCASCGKPKTNSAAKRFRDALSLVLPHDHIKAVSERLYKWRSGTAHAGRLHATETSFGFPKMSESMMVENKPSLFLVRGPHHAQEIARDLLIRLLEKRPLARP